MKQKTLVVVLGPTGVGKTELCLRIAEHLNVPIINADSRQIFAELPIGTAAPTQEQQRRVHHYFVGNHQLDDYYSASIYESEVLQLLTSMFSNGRDTALLSGGSMMYIDAVCKGIDDIPTINDDVREAMKKRLADEGLEALVEDLKRLDPEHWEIVDRNNPRRVVHALEICVQTGRTYSSFRTNTVKERPFRILKIGLDRPREEQYDRINRRVLQMMADGLEEEARRVLPLRSFNSLNTVGYKELFSYFDGVIPRDEAVRQIQSNTRRYMRKQLTWFKKDKSIKWFSPENIEEILKYIDNSINFSS